MIDSFGLASSAMARVVALPDAAPVVAPEKCYNFHKRRDVECPSRDPAAIFPPRLPVPNRRLIETGKLFTNSNLELRCIHTKYACGSSAEGARDEKKNRTAACRRTAPPKGSHHTRRRRRKAPGTSQAETSHARLAQGARSARTDRNRRRLSTRRAGRRDRPASIGPTLSNAAAAAFILTHRRP